MQSWITENAAFMSDTKLNLKMNHPYKKGNANDKFKHFEETTLRWTHIHSYYVPFHGL